jgi:hypothetical protein
MSTDPSLLGVFDNQTAEIDLVECARHCPTLALSRLYRTDFRRGAAGAGPLCLFKSPVSQTFGTDRGVNWRTAARQALSPVIFQEGSWLHLRSFVTDTIGADKEQEAMAFMVAHNLV